MAAQCSADTFVVNQSSVLRINIDGENRHLRQAANRYMTVGELIKHRRFEEAIEAIRLGLIENPGNQDLLIKLIDLPHDTHFSNENLASKLLETLEEFEEKGIINDTDIEWALVEGKTILQNNAIHKHFQFELDNLKGFIEKYPNDKKAILHYIRRCTENCIFPDELNPEYYISENNELDQRFLIQLYFSFALNRICAESSKPVSHKLEIAKNYLNKAFLINPNDSTMLLKDVLSADQTGNWLLLIDEKSMNMLQEIQEGFGHR